MATLQRSCERSKFQLRIRNITRRDVWSREKPRRRRIPQILPTPPVADLAKWYRRQAANRLQNSVATNLQKRFTLNLRMHALLFTELRGKDPPERLFFEFVNACSLVYGIEWQRTYCSSCTFNL
ncbi:hypothetical protein AVEN_172532-1 [Araneus ventricosus]|uniref:Uncharacterized protein n=1 Tax=Araneus ventricosus TaxID=182803 RepID=A0A4Y2K3H6_ARAVE|nr:hypothetical protein AVEN_172532-1 [Araneus ventricosus]